MSRSPSAPPPETVGARIRALRLAGELTQEQLAAACGVSRSAVAQWETDRAGQLRGNISRIAAALGASVEFVLEGERPPSGLTGDELAMLRLYRACDAEDRTFLLRTARKLAEPTARPLRAES
jgi:transcriptional regulator with XRE-family HTH domain